MGPPVQPEPSASCFRSAWTGASLKILPCVCMSTVFGVGTEGHTYCGLVCACVRIHLCVCVCHTLSAHTLRCVDQQWVNEVMHAWIPKSTYTVGTRKNTFSYICNYASQPGWQLFWMFIDTQRDVDTNTPYYCWKHTQSLGTQINVRKHWSPLTRKYPEGIVTPPHREKREASVSASRMSVVHKPRRKRSCVCHCANTCLCSFIGLTD